MQPPPPLLKLGNGEDANDITEHEVRAWRVTWIDVGLAVAMASFFYGFVELIL